MAWFHNLSNPMLPITCVIPVGGYGRRFHEISQGIPKPLVPIIGNRGSLELLIRNISSFGIRHFILTEHYKAEEFALLSSRISSELDIQIDQVYEDQALGECGSLWNLSGLEDHILFVNGDLLERFSFDSLIRRHIDYDADMTLVCHTSTHTHDSDLIETSHRTKITRLIPKIHKQYEFTSYIGFSAISIFKKKLLDSIQRPPSTSTPSLFSYLAYHSHNKGFRVIAHPTLDYIKDIGTTERFLSIAEYTKTLCSPSNNMKRVLFVDRDNTLIKCNPREYICSVGEVELIPSNVAAIAHLAKDYDATIMITNQPQVAMGRLSLHDLFCINTEIVRKCMAHNLRIGDIYQCIHHPHHGYPGEIENLKYECFCRKPKPGLLLEASYEHSIDLENSVFIGDSDADRKASESVNMDFVHVQSIVTK